MPERIAKRLLIIGWDAADWIIIDQLFAHGGMPNLRKLVDQGARANLASLEPRLSPLLWTTVATGKTADKHGILNFIEPNPSGEGVRLASSTSRKTKALWNMLTQSKMRVNVVGWYATFPAEPINGTCVTNYVQEGFAPDPHEPWPMNPATVHPPQMREAIAEVRTHPANLNAHALVPLIPGLKEEHLSDPRVQKLARHVAHCSSIHNAVTTILADDAEWDCTMVFYETIDTVGHNFMQYHPPKMAHVLEQDFQMFGEVMYGIYQFHDMMLGTLLDLAGPDTTVILLSDHGFYSDQRRPVIQPEQISVDERLALETRWHRPLGVLAMSGPGITSGQRVFGASLLDIAPTALTLLGLPVGADMTGRVLAEAFAVAGKPVHVEKVLSWDMVPGDAGLHPPDVRLDPFEAHEALKQLVDLGYMPELPSDAREQAEAARREMQCNLGTVLTVSGQVPKAIEIFEQLRKQYPAEPRYTLALCRAFFTAGEYERCRIVAEEFLATRPDHVPAQFTRVLAMAHVGAHEQAKRHLQQLEQVAGDRAEFAATFAEAHSLLEQWDEAKHYFEIALAQDTENAGLHLELGKIAVRQQQFEEAVEHCLAAVHRIHFFPEAHFALGVALVGLRDFDHALKSFHVAISMRPGFLDAHRYLATIYRNRGDAENAAKHRQIAERLIEEQGSGHVSIDFLKRDAPLEPQAWTKTLGKSNEH